MYVCSKPLWGSLYILSAVLKLNTGKKILLAKRTTHLSPWWPDSGTPSTCRCSSLNRSPPPGAPPRLWGPATASIEPTTNVYPSGPISQAFPLSSYSQTHWAWDSSPPKTETFFNWMRLMKISLTLLQEVMQSPM